MSEQPLTQRQNLSAAELRERRRRKILEGSEQRMRKVMYGGSSENNEPLSHGNRDGTETADGICSVEQILPSSDPVGFNGEAIGRLRPSDVGFCRSESTAHYECHIKPVSVQHHSAEASSSSVGILSEQGDCRHELSTTATQHRNSAPRPTSGPATPRTYSVQQALSNDDDAGDDDGMNDEDVAAVQSQSFTRVYICAVVAVLVRLVLHTTFSASFVQNVVVPFLTMEILFISHWIHNGMNADFGSSRMMSMLLTLYSTMLPEFVRAIQPFIHQASRIMDDFAVYMFFFICVHIFLGQII